MDLRSFAFCAKLIAMKTNIVALSNANMSGNTEVPGRDGLSESDSSFLTRAESDMTATIFLMFEKHMRGSGGCAESTIELAIGALRGFMNHVKVPPWRWMTRHVDDFLSYKVSEGSISVGRQGTYITYLRQLQNYLRDERGLCNEILEKFGAQPQTFIDSENAIAIKKKNHTRKKAIKALSGEECQRIIDEFDAMIKLAKQTSSKAYKTLMRDKIMTQVMLMTGLRVDELVNLTVHNFSSDAKNPNFGDFALLTVVKGKGRKTRVVRLYNPLIKDVMEWYLNKVRGAFLSKDTEDFNLLFLSERGNKLCTEQVRRMITDIRVAAGIHTRVTPHTLRHTYATQMAPIIGPEALQRNLGHQHLSTTLGTYYHQDPQLVGDTVRQGIMNFALAATNMTEGL